MKRFVITFLTLALFHGWGCATRRPRLSGSGSAEVMEYLASTIREPREVGTFETFDGTRLGYVRYRSCENRNRTALIYLHGISSHAGWFDMAASRLRIRGYDVFCLDRRGSGINRENRGFHSGYVDSVKTLFSDNRVFIEPVRKHYDRVFIVGLSWGGKHSLAYGLTRPGDCDGLVLITPGIRALVDLTFFQKVKIFLTAGIFPRTQIRIPIQPEMFTSTPRHLDYIRSDPLRLHTVSSRFLMESRWLDGYIDKFMPENQLPIQVFLAGNDRIIDNQGILEVLEHTKKELTVVEYEDQTHSIQFDAVDRLVADMDLWLQEQIKLKQVQAAVQS